jgi:hypothetical protein
MASESLAGLESGFENGCPEGIFDYVFAKEGK